MKRSFCTGLSRPAHMSARRLKPAVSTGAASFLQSRDRALRSLAAGAPLRLSELRALDVADVDWRRERLRVQRRGVAAYVWVAEEALECLEAYLDTRPEPRRSISGEPLFLSRLRKRLSVRQMRDILADAALITSIDAPEAPR